MKMKALAYRFVPKPFMNELRHRKHLRDLATAVEPEEADLRQVINRGDTVLDIGANFGVFTKLFSQLVGSQGSVIAFEPVPQTFRTLAAGVRRYKLSNVTAVNKAISDQIDTVSMVIPAYKGNKGDNLYEAHIVNAPETRETFHVSAVTIDSIKLIRVDFMKIDVEGHDLEVLHGSKETLERLHPTLMVEVTTPGTVEFLCDEMGYRQPVTVSPSNQLFVHATH